VNQQARYAYQFYIDRGLAPHVAAGIVGNLAVESGNFDPNVISGTRRGDSGSAWYVQQLRGTRKTNFENWAKANKLDKTSLDAQLAFVLEEMNPPVPVQGPHRSGQPQRDPQRGQRRRSRRQLHEALRAPEPRTPPSISRRSAWRSPKG
jgi:hypothetical protein